MEMLKKFTLQNVILLANRGQSSLANVLTLSVHDNATARKHLVQLTVSGHLTIRDGAFHPTTLGLKDADIGL